MLLAGFELRRNWIKVFMGHVIRKTLFQNYLAKNSMYSKAQSIRFNLNMTFRLKMIKNSSLGKSFCRWVKSFFALGVRKSVLEELSFAKYDFLVKSNFLDLIKFDLLDFTKLDFLDLVKFAVVDRFSIFQPKHLLPLTTPEL